ncbi:PREDICTED: uncharacterized protein At3g43530-like [Camelina sativa]|uniref:Uncharacterized protein At3g43530-like n=1 Tax=Camelina sativa TaxID=90675 RepID=A0ABM1QD51_CAMSA|nr:PREDICTED: uncharacterized protein At3g43530-like [Camelina sativa]XP_019084689.1 PREDICTED: uncharacterized protein At3g43530-like [Camelina sativa]XP_019084690.1 PREDICTED: uncharacterized protein At3g43530-like [Camelina sativa]
MDVQEKFHEMRGFPLSKINDELGTTEVIDSILVPIDDNEKSLLQRITEKDDMDDTYDIVNHIHKGYNVRFEDMFNEDVQSRGGGGVRGESENMNEEVAAIEGPGNPSVADLVDLVNNFTTKGFLSLSMILYSSSKVLSVVTFSFSATDHKSASNSLLNAPIYLQSIQTWRLRDVH